MTSVWSGMIALVLTAVIGWFLVPALRALKAGQSIKEIGPSWHMSKQGTPTMGGIMFMAAITICVLAFGWRTWRPGISVPCLCWYLPWCTGRSALWTTTPKSKSTRIPG